MIVKACLEDMEDIYNLMCILENKELDKEHFVQTYQQNIQDEDVIYLVYKEDRILGFISFVVHHYLHHDRDMGEIVELVVLPECRGKRIGQQLLQEIEKKAIDLHLEQIELSTSTYRKQAHHFYEQNDYEMLHYNYTKNL
ncbi:GNAT family N-acetyltransferase [Massilimicrobiota timonensis]|uniref:GNAT family N-acetyltransferase n=1 Tax=Massilimicrobiota timonensis TaxID=1776392 RepID=UPI00196061AA|nr:GNAT family N-acetyltransferase [Massilimicrobiota timonensis]MBM6966887.1 GNAT family N-acetyltransferase [Massilimicrobiota timonensis]